jgi:hypothetical protein
MSTGRTTLWGVGALVVAVVLVVALRPRPPVDARTQVEALTADVAKAVEHEWVPRIIGKLADDYSDDMGNSRTSLKANLREAMLGPREWHVEWQTVSVDEPDRDTVRARLNMDATELENGSPLATYRGRLDVTFRRVGRELRAVRVDGLKSIADKVEARYNGD